MSLYRNSEGYYDPTAGEALSRICKEERAARRKAAQKKSGVTSGEVRKNKSGPIKTVKTITVDPAEELANAIVVRAVEDYRGTMNEKDLRVIEEFFLSDWFEILTSIDGKVLLQKLRSEKQRES